MNATVRAAALAASLAVIAAASATEGAGPPSCKNHYILSAPCEAPDRIVWTPAAAPLLNHNWGASATLLKDGRVLLTGGALNGVGAEIYDPAIDGWLIAAPMNVMRMDHRAVRLRDGRVLVVGGDMTYGYASATAEIYDPATGAWSLTPPLNFHRRTWWRSDLTANLLLDGSVLVTGGNDSGWTARAEAEIYDPAAGAWRVTGSLAMGRVGHTATTLADGTVLVVGGVWDWDFWFYRDEAELYDPAAGEWRMLGPTPARVNHTATLRADGSVLIAGGQTPTPTYGPLAERPAFWPYGSTGESFLYVPVNRETVSIATLASPRHGHVAVATPGGLLVVGGRLDRMPIVYHATTARVEHSERYGADSRAWSLMEEIGTPPYEPYSATQIGEGRMLFVGPFGAYLLSY